MTRIAYVNGTYLPAAEATVSIFDRGFLFADGVYEVTAVLDGRLIDADAHFARLERSLRELDMALPVTLEKLYEVLRELILRYDAAADLVEVLGNQRVFDHLAAATDVAHDHAADLRFLVL